MERSRSGYRSARVEEGGEQRDALRELGRDPVLSKFLSDDFNATQFASDALRTGSAAASADKVEQGLALLEKQLGGEVVARHSQLIEQLSSVKEVAGSLAFIKAGVGSLETSVRKVRSEVAEPYRSVKSKSAQLVSMHTTLELLRALVRVFKPLKRLHELFSTSKSLDLIKASKLYSEIEAIRRDTDLTGIHFIDAEAAWLVQAGNKVRTQAMQSLEAGLNAFGHSEIGDALQVYFNLGELKPAVESVISKYKSQVVKSVTTAFDMKAISASMAVAATAPGGVHRSGTPQLGAGSKSREALWQRLGACMDQLHSILLSMWHLDRVLSKKRDPATHVRFLDEVFQAGESLVVERVWESVIKAFATQMKSAFTTSSFVKETLMLAYPKLLGTADNFLQRLMSVKDGKGGSPAIGEKDRLEFVATLEPFQSAYLGHVLTRLTEHVNNVFRGGLPATQDPNSKLVTRIQEDVEAVKMDPGLTALVCREVGKALRLFAERSEYQVSVGPDARQVTAAATPAQRKNMALCLLLQDLHHRVSSILPGLPPAAAQVLSPSVDALSRVAVETLTPLFKAMVERLEKSIIQMHELDFNSDMAAMNDDRPKYIQDVQEATMHFRQEFLPKLPPAASSASSITVAFARKLASRVLVLFVRHASLVRPLSEDGKLTMARDMAEVELLVAQNLFPVEQLGAPYRALRAFRRFIFLEANQISDSPLLQDLPPNVVFHHLFTRAPEELESPMKRTKLTPSQYSLWLDSHTEHDVWKEVKATLDEYAARVKARGDKQFAPLYPLMFQLATSFQLAS